MIINREEVVQSALNVQRWCFNHYDDENPCDCPFFNEDNYNECKFGSTPTQSSLILEEFLRTRGLKYD